MSVCLSIPEVGAPIFAKVEGLSLKVRTGCP